MLHFLLGDIPVFPSRKFAWWLAGKCGGYVMVISTVATWFGKPGNPFEWGEWGIAHPPSGDTVWRAVVLLIGILLITGDPRKSIPSLFRRRRVEAPTLVSAPATPDPPDLVQFIRASMMPTADLAIDILRSIQAPMTRLGTPFPNYGILLDRAIIEPAGNARIAVNNRLSNNDPVTLDERSARLYETYQWTVTWIVQAGDDAGFTWGIQRVEDWLEQDAEMRKRLRDLIARPDFVESALARSVVSVGWNDTSKETIRKLRETATHR